MKPLALTMTILFLANPLWAKAKKNNASEKPFRGGYIYELNSDRQKLLFTIEAELKEQKDGDRVFTSRYIDGDRNEVMSEVGEFKNLELIKYVVQQKQLNEEYEIKNNNGKLIFSVTSGGKTESKTSNSPDNLLLSPTFVPFIRSHWDKISQNSRVEAELAVPEQMRTFAFTFEKLRSEVVNGEKQIVLRMKPKNTLVSALVRPIFLTVSEDGSRILSIKGHMLPKLKRGQRWVDFNGEAVFQY